MVMTDITMGMTVTGLRVMPQPVTLIKHVKIKRKSVLTE
jgi:hypothetical protein